MKKSTRTIFLILLACVVLLSLIWVYFQRSMDLIEQADAGTGTVYQKHYVLIPDSENSLLWQSVYTSAKAAAAEADAYLELIQPSTNASYSLVDCLRIAIASQVDGIILRPDGSEGVRALIDEAVEDGIPVITVLDDDSDSQRVSFVGLNSYQMADTYSAQIQKFLKPGTTRVLALLNADAKNPGKNLIYTQIVRNMEQRKSPEQTVEISAYNIDSSTDFDSEEAIRDIFVNQDTLPDVLLCMDQVSTECACQALVDYNEVGNIDIIGFHYSDSILDAVEKRNVPVTIALDAEEIGRYSVNALTDYVSLGHASSYYSVDISIITSENAGSFRSREETAGGEP